MDRSLTGAGSAVWRNGQLNSLSRVGRFIRRRPLLVISVLVIVVLTLTAIFAKSLAPFDPNSITGRRLESPSATHRFGTDGAGRDVLSRALVGAQLSLTVGVTIAITGTVLGTLLGAYSGFVGGWVDLLLQRLIDVLQSIPSLILALAIVSVLTPTTKNLILGLFWIFIPSSTRVIRSGALSLRSREFIISARVVGASELRILALYVLPQLMAPFLILVSIGVGFGILIESSLEFLGVGPLPPAVSWGAMMTGATTLAERAPWVLLAPSIGLGLTVYAFNLLGDSLRDLLDPRLRT